MVVPLIWTPSKQKTVEICDKYTESILKHLFDYFMSTVPENSELKKVEIQMLKNLIFNSSVRHVDKVDCDKGTVRCTATKELLIEWMEKEGMIKVSNAPAPMFVRLD